MLYPPSPRDSQPGSNEDPPSLRFFILLVKYYQNRFILLFMTSFNCDILSEGGFQSRKESVIIITPSGIIRNKPFFPKNLSKYFSPIWSSEEFEEEEVGGGIVVCHQPPTKTQVFGLFRSRLIPTLSIIIRIISFDWNSNK